MKTKFFLLLAITLLAGNIALLKSSWYYPSNSQAANCKALQSLLPTKAIAHSVTGVCFFNKEKLMNPANIPGLTNMNAGGSAIPGTTNLSLGGGLGTPVFGTPTQTNTNNNTNNNQTLQQGAAGQAILGQAYDSSMNNLQGQMDQINPLQQTSVNDLNNQVNQQGNQLQDQYATGQANQQLGQNQLDLSHTNSVRNLGDQLRGALNGYVNQLGIQGAGNSSAAPMIGYALQQQGNQSMSDLNNNYNNQQTGLNVAGASLQKGFQDQNNQLEAYRTAQIHQITQTYLAQSQALQNQMSSLGFSKVYALQANQQLAQQALNQLQAIENNHAQGTQAIAQAYQVSQAAPTADLSALNSNFNVQNQTNPGVAGLSLNANQAQNNATGANMPVSLQKQPQNLTTPF